MHAKYHREITAEASQGFFQPNPLEIIISANLGQDGLLGQIGHNEYHFDANAFAAGNAYIDRQRQIVLDALQPAGRDQPSLLNAWKATGRLLHTAQDYYAHSNYTFLWLDSHKGAIPEEIDPLDRQVMDSPSLHSGKVYYPLELFYFIPALRPFVLRWLPHDSHAWMNLDGPSQGKLFAYALCAARKRSQYELGLITSRLDPHQLKLYSGK